MCFYLCACVDIEASSFLHLDKIFDYILSWVLIDISICKTSSVMSTL